MHLPSRLSGAVPCPRHRHVCPAFTPISLSPPKRSPSRLWGSLWDTVCTMHVFVVLLFGAHSGEWICCVVVPKVIVTLTNEERGEEEEKRPKNHHPSIPSL